jgi:hypothetical protein
MILICYLKASSSPNKNESIDLLDIPMDGIEGSHELDEYFLKPMEKVQDPVA